MRKSFMVEFTGTPEAGKTTTIKNVTNKLINEGYKVTVLQESAENLPNEIPKGTWDANMWMHYNTQAALIRAKYLDVDIVIIDRGLIDSNFYGMKFLWENVCNKQQYDNFRNKFIDELFPDFLIALTVSPEIAIKRRGGAGRLVNEEYIRKYNQVFMKYFETITTPKTLIDTSDFTIYDINQLIFDCIKKILP